MCGRASARIFLVADLLIIHFHHVCVRTNGPGVHESAVFANGPLCARKPCVCTRIGNVHKRQCLASRDARAG
jgi:hypothetical protein